MKFNQLKAGAMLSYASMFLTNTIAIFYTPFMLRHLGQAEYGIYALMGSLVGFLGILELGFGNTVVRYIAEYRAQNDRIKESNLVAICLRIYGVIGLICLIIGGFIYLNLGKIFSDGLTGTEIDTAKIIFLLLILNLALSFPFNVFSSIISGYERFVLRNTITIARSIVLPCIMIPLLLLGYKAISIVVVQTILNIVAALINIGYVILVLKVKVKLHYLDRSFVKELLNYSSYVFLGAIVNQIYWNTDQTILGIVANSAAISVYAIGNQMVGFYMALSASISTMFLPRATKMVVNNANNDELTGFFVRIARLQFIVLGLFLSGFYLYGREFITLWAGTQYADSWLIAIILMASNTIPLVQQVGVSILQAKNKHRFRSIMYLFMAVANVFVSFPLAKLYGGIGSAIGTALALVIGNIMIINLYYHFKLKLNILHFFRQLLNRLLPSMLVSLLLGLLLRMIPIDSWLGLIVKCVSFIFVYGVILWAGGINDSEKNLIFGSILNRKRVVQKTV